MLDNNETDLDFQLNFFNSFACTGIDLINFSMDGQTPEEKDRLNIYLR